MPTLILLLVFQRDLAAAEHHQQQAIAITVRIFMWSLQAKSGTG